MNRKIYDRIKALKRQIMPNDRLILFGSQARGNARADSDWDLLILLKKEEKKFIEDYEKYGYPFDEIGWEYDVAINPLLYTEKEWEKRKNTSFYNNVEKEGSEII